MEKKFELTEVTLNYNGHTLHRIKALKDFSDVKKGDLGGYVQDEDNISHLGNCWIYDNAMVYGNSVIESNAKVCGEAVIENSRILDSALVKNKAKVVNSTVKDSAWVFGSSRIFNNSKIMGFSRVFDFAQVEDSLVQGEARVLGTAILLKAEVLDSATVGGITHCYPFTRICGNANVSSGYFTDIIIGTNDQFNEYMSSISILRDRFRCELKKKEEGY